ncbi:MULTISPECIES: GAF and ANTAR domain-containing protein [unclassified Arthrobacter]|uniref:GAF and ANTAR domain-containing protein n=1 Tax=unclassified Arthrobacter TaxID=235627 RepID=UPI00222710BC|nr:MULTISPECIES: GAF and ANTAR domain-containing protein [unclassified Arthrobacter]UYY82439.1 GAF and ANTAR domain-containing protein [Arthrobacter sp. YA7-1]
MARKLPLDELSTVIARIQGLLLTEEKVDRAVRLLARAIKDSVSGATGAGVSILDSRGRRTSSASTDEVVTRGDALQYDLGQGPCLTAWAMEETVTVRDVVTDPRWPDWTDVVRDMPIRSVVSTPLIAEQECIGALKIYSDRADAFGDEAARVLELFAAPAATLLANIQASEAPHRISEALAESLHSRDLVNRACGILMQRHSLTVDMALAELMRRARRQNSTLGQISADIVAGIPAALE